MGEGKSNKLSVVVSGIVVISSVVIVVVLAALYGTKYNCEDDSEPSMIHYSNIQQQVTRGSTQVAGGRSFMKTIAYSPGAGKEMQGGVFQLDKGEVLSYVNWNECFVIILTGQFEIHDGHTTSTGKVGQSFYIPRGSSITFRAATSRSLLYYAQHPSSLEAVAEVQAAIKRKPKIVAQPYYGDIKVPLFKNNFQSLSYLQDILFSTVKGREMTAGLYRLLKGPALDYRYDYEEFKLILQGEFHLLDGSGKFVVAKAGDLMYFPKGTWVRFTSPGSALGFYVGQRVGDSA